MMYASHGLIIDTVVHCLTHLRTLKLLIQYMAIQIQVEQIPVKINIFRFSTISIIGGKRWIISRKNKRTCHSK